MQNAVRSARFSLLWLWLSHTARQATNFALLFCVFLPLGLHESALSLSSCLIAIVLLAALTAWITNSHAKRSVLTRSASYYFVGAILAAPLAGEEWAQWFLKVF